MVGMRKIGFLNYLNATSKQFMAIFICSFSFKKTMHVLDVNEIFGMPFYTFEKIIEEGWKNWPDAFALYVRLIEQSRIQQTNQTRSLNVFLKNWFWRWDDKLKKARLILKKLWLIDDVEVRDELGRITWHYVRVNYLINEQKIRTLGITYNLSTSGFTHDVDNSTSGETDTNALSNKIVNALSNKNKKGNKNQKSVSELVEACMNDERINTVFSREDIEEWLNYKEMKKQQYSTVNSCIQQLVIAKRDITLWQPKLDITKRFNFAVNYAIGKWRDWIHWYETTEREYLATKKDFYPNPNLDE